MKMQDKRQTKESQQRQMPNQRQTKERQQCQRPEPETNKGKAPVSKAEPETSEGKAPVSKAEPTTEIRETWGQWSSQAQEVDSWHRSRSWYEDAWAADAWQQPWSWASQNHDDYDYGRGWGYWYSRQTSWDYDAKDWGYNSGWDHGGAFRKQSSWQANLGRPATCDLFDPPPTPKTKSPHQGAAPEAKTPPPAASEENGKGSPSPDADKKNEEALKMKELQKKHHAKYMRFFRLLESVQLSFSFKWLIDLRTSAHNLLKLEAPGVRMKSFRLATI